MESETAVNWLLVFALVSQGACSSKAPPSKPDKPPASIDAGGGAGSGSGAGVNQKVLIKHPFSLEVFSIEGRGNLGPAEIDAVERFTAALRTAAREFDAIHLGQKNRELVDEKLVMSCEDESPKCMANIAHDVDADRIIWGHAGVANKRMKADVHLLVAETKQVVDYQITDSPIDDDALRVTARDAIASLLSRAP